MKKTNTVFTLAISRLRFHKSRTLLTGIAIMLTTMLLTAIGTVGIATFDMNRQMYSTEDYHAIFKRLTTDQVNILSKHINVEAMNTSEVFADIVNGKMNGVLIYQETLKDERPANEGSVFSPQKAESGYYPEAEDEICSSPAFFRRVGAEPVVGGKVTLSFRVNGKGEILTKEFTISGLFSDVEIDEGIDDSRLMWGAHVSKELLDKYSVDGIYKPSFNSQLRVYGEEDLTYNEITDKIKTVASDIGLHENDININKEYLYTMTDPGTEIIAVVAAISLIVIL
ncbi:MAG: hypothetical protein K2N43_05485, partial [Lachnospiraceae bacterium]|nr:hypothetical protein [Lachnospiraceae bacterium]